MNPDLFPITQLKEFGLWPNTNLVSRGIIPYINRIRKDRVKITVVGDLKGETTADILENCSNVFRIYSINDYSSCKEPEVYKELFDTNTAQHTQKIRQKSDRESDVVIIESSSMPRSCSSDELRIYYDLVKHGGIFCGNGHDMKNVKDDLNKFRREAKIGTPILISNLHVWFWYKR